MREILFQAKRLDNREWVEGSLISFADGGRAILPSKSAALYKKGASLFSTVNCLEVAPSTVCQYTGLTDRNGVKIFEGDKLYDPHENMIYTVGWSEEQAVFQMKYSWHRKSVESAHYCEIIGFIHDGEGGQHE